MSWVGWSEAIMHTVFIVLLVCLFSVFCTFMSQRRAVCSHGPYGSPLLQCLSSHFILCTPPPCHRSVKASYLMHLSMQHFENSQTDRLNCIQIAFKIVLC